MKTPPAATNTDLANALKRYFYSFFINQRRLSKHTVSAYRDTFKLFLPYVARHHKKCISTLCFDDLNADIVILFLQHLEDERNNKVQTRNARLTAIRSFLRFAITDKPDLMANMQPILAIPEKRKDRFTSDYLTKHEIDALLSTPDLSNWHGRRDYIMLLLLYNTGARVSELINLQVKDVDLVRQQAIHFFGKGRKERIVPLWSQTITALKRWLVELPQDPSASLLPNRHGVAITRFGVKQRLDWAVKKAWKIIPTLKNRYISPHSIRHTTAMHLLQSGVDLTVIALWLGHAKLETTHQYMQADIEMKREALAKLPAVGAVTNSAIDVKNEGILAFLENL
jgi:integrase/recombinase XerD